VLSAPSATERLLILPPLAIGFNMETVQYKTIKFQVWDLGGACFSVHLGCPMPCFIYVFDFLVPLVIHERQANPAYGKSLVHPVSTFTPYVLPSRPIAQTILAVLFCEYACDRLRDR
jgi:ADP-ribosylation factor family